MKVKPRKNAPVIKMNAAQRAWCKDYKHYTTFTPMMDDFLSGNESFQVAATKSVRWFEDWSSDAHLNAGRNIPGDDT